MLRWVLLGLCLSLGRGASAEVLYCTFERSHLTGHVFPEAMQLHLGPGPGQVVAHVRTEDGVGAMPGQITKTTRYRQRFVFHVDGLRDGAGQAHRITYRLNLHRASGRVTALAEPLGSGQSFRAEGRCIGG